MFGLPFFSRPAPVRCEPESPMLDSKGHLPPHMRGSNPEEQSGGMVPPIEPSLEKGKGLGWWTPFVTAQPKNASASWDMANFWTIAAGLTISTSAPKLLKISSQKGKIAITLGTWTFCSFLLVRNLNNKFWEDEKDNRLKIKEEAMYKKKQQELGLKGPGPLGDNFETGFGGQEGLRDKFATTRGDH